MPQPSRRDAGYWRDRALRAEARLREEVATALAANGDSTSDTIYTLPITETTVGLNDLLYLEGLGLMEVRGPLFDEHGDASHQLSFRPCHPLEDTLKRAATVTEVDSQRAYQHAHHRLQHERWPNREQETNDAPANHC